MSQNRRRLALFALLFLAALLANSSNSDTSLVRPADAAQATNYGALLADDVGMAGGSGIDFTSNVLNTTIFGFVRDAATNMPVSGARVDTGIGSGNGVTTNSSGAYTLTVSGGTWSLNASMAGYLSASQSVSLADNEHRTGIDFLLTPAHSVITGTVLLSTGGPVGWQWVTASEQSTGVSNGVWVDTQGIYTVSVTPGTWALSSLRAGATLSEIPLVNIGDYQTIGSIDLVLLPNDATVTGRVHDQLGNGLNRARVRAIDSITGYSLTTYSYTDASGVYTLTVASGTRTIAASMAGYVFSPTVRTVTLPPDQSDQDFTGTIVVIPAAVAIEGPAAAVVSAPYSFVATVSPLTATTPIRFTWLATDQSNVTHTGNLTDSVSFIWDTPGTKIITATAANNSGNASQTLTVMVRACLADLDEDGYVSIGDVQGVAGRWSSMRGQTDYDEKFDLNYDGEIDIVDVQTVAGRWNSRCGGAAP